MTSTFTTRFAALLATCAVLAVIHAAPVKVGRRAKALPPEMAAQDVAYSLEELIKWELLDDPKATLGDVLDLLQQKYEVRVKFSVNEKAFRKAFEEPRDVRSEVVGKIEGGTVTLRKLLDAILFKINVPSGAAFLVRRGSVEITTVEALEIELGLPKTRGKGLWMLPRIVYHLEVTAMKFSDVCDKIADECEITVLIDPRVKEKADTKIKATLRNAAVSTALDRLADMAGLAVARKGNVYYVTTPENAKNLATPPTRGRRR
jgi:hypothetical protein